MTAHIRFLSRVTGVVLLDESPEDLNITMSLGSSSEWSASFPGTTPYITLISEGDYVEIYYKSIKILDGIVQSISKKIKSTSFSYDIKGRSYLDNLYNSRAYSQAYYQDTYLLTVLGELLRPAGWRIGDISTMLDPNQKTTIDLRSEKRLLAQVTSLLKGVPATFYREGGVIAGKQSLDVGYFRGQSNIILTHAPSSELEIQEDPLVGRVVDVSVSYETENIVEAIEAIGGEVKDNLGVTRMINLGDALAADPTLATNPDFPIETILAGYIYRVKNASIFSGSGADTTETFNQYAPERTSGNATLAAVKAAGLALYTRAVAFLKDHSSDVVEYSLNVVGSDLFTKIGDVCRIVVNIRQSVVDKFSNNDTIYYSNIDVDARVVKLSFSVNKEKEDWSFTVTDGDKILDEDFIVSMYDQSKTTSTQAGSVYTPSYSPTLVATLHSQVGGIPNVVTDEGLPAIEVTAALPLPAPVGSSGVYLGGLPFGTSPNGPLVVELVNDPVYATDGAKIRLYIKNVGWNSGFTADVTIYYIWY